MTCFVLSHCSFRSPRAWYFGSCSGSDSGSGRVKDSGGGPVKYSFANTPGVRAAALIALSCTCCRRDTFSMPPWEIIQDVCSNFHASLPIDLTLFRGTKETGSSDKRLLHYIYKCHVIFCASNINFKYLNSCKIF